MKNATRLLSLSYVIGIVLVALITFAPQVGFCALLVVSGFDDDATLTLSVQDVIVRGTMGDLGSVRLLVTDDDVAFTTGDSAEIFVYEDDTLLDDLLWSTSFTFTSAEISAGLVDRTIGFTFDTLTISDPGDNLELYGEAVVYKSASSIIFPYDRPQTAILNVALADAVPIPSAVWLLGSAFIGLVGFRRKFRKS